MALIASVSDSIYLPSYASGSPAVDLVEIIGGQTVALQLDPLADNNDAADNVGTDVEDTDDSVGLNSLTIVSEDAAPQLATGDNAGSEAIGETPPNEETVPEDRNGEQTADADTVSLHGIDVSEHNGEIDWEAVAESGKVDFAIIRCGYGQDVAKQDDKKFVRNVSECERLGIPYGVYLYSYATDTDKALGEAHHVLRLLDEHHPSLPVYYDLEEKSIAETGRDNIASIASTFCDAIADAGYTPGIYANTNWWNKYLTDPVFNEWDKWVAQYNHECTYDGDYSVWQYTDAGSSDGIRSRGLDMDLLSSATIPANIFYIGEATASGVSVLPNADGSAKMFDEYKLDIVNTSLSSLSGLTVRADVDGISCSVDIQSSNELPVNGKATVTATIPKDFDVSTLKNNSIGITITGLDENGNSVSDVTSITI